MRYKSKLAGQSPDSVTHDLDAMALEYRRRTFHRSIYQSRSPSGGHLGNVSDGTHPNDRHGRHYRNYRIVGTLPCLVDQYPVS